MAPIHPEITYAERSSATEPEKNIIYFTINTPNIEGEPKLDIKPQEISFSASTGDAAKGVPVKDYAFDLQLWGEIVPEETKKLQTSRALVLVLRKKELRAEYWPRLTKEKPNRNWIKTDFSKWVDEDEQDEAPEVEGMDGMAGMGGMPGLGGMGGAGGPGGMDFAKMMEQMGGMGALGGGGADGLQGLNMDQFGGDDDDDDDDFENAEGEETAQSNDKAKEAKEVKKEANLEEVE